MDLDTVTAVQDARTVDAWRPGDAWLAGGTCLFSEPQPQLRRLIDLGHMGWPPLVLTADGLEISSTCTIAELVAIDAPGHWPVCQVLFEQCAQAFLASIEIRNVATVGGNLCRARPAGPMIALTAALDGVCTILTPDGGGRRVSVVDFVTGDSQSVLTPGELLRSVFLPAAALRCSTAFRRASLQPGSRSAALIIGRVDPITATFKLTISASTQRPFVLTFDQPPRAPALQETIAAVLPAADYLDDEHGDRQWRERLTWMFAEEVRAELVDRR